VHCQQAEIGGKLCPQCQGRGKCISRSVYRERIILHNIPCPLCAGTGQMDESPAAGEESLSPEVRRTAVASPSRMAWAGTVSAASPAAGDSSVE